MPDPDALNKELEEIKQALANLTKDSRAYKSLMAEKAELEAQLTGSGAIAQGEGAQAVGQDGIGIQGDMAESSLINGNDNIQNSTVIFTGDGAKIVVGEQPVAMKAKFRKTYLGRYLEHIVAHNRYLQLQGIRSGGKLVNIELEQIYIRLRTSQQRTLQSEEEMLGAEAAFAPGERNRKEHLGASAETLTVSVELALGNHRHLVILGDPGSGKTTLLRYLALLYGRDLAEGQHILKEKLKLAESGYLPILLPLRQIGQFLKAHHPKSDGTDGHALLLDFLLKTLQNQMVKLPVEHFEAALSKGQAIVLLDGLDEVADPDLRARVARLVEAFTLAYPKARFVVTSRVVGYTGAARLGGDYVTTTVRDFTLEDVRQFLTHWNQLVAVGQMGAVETAQTHAAAQTAQLMNAIQANERVRELAINPLMLTVIALVHRDRVKLPDRRAELYAEAVDVLLGKWDEARGLGEIAILEDRPFDAGDRRLLLQTVALYMHERAKKELEAEELKTILQSAFVPLTPDKSAARRAVERFLRVVEERTGLLAARGEGVYAFSHLTFQEYLAALAISARDDYVDYTIQRSGEPWWREVILLTAGYLSTQSKERTTKLIQALAVKKKEPQPYYNLVLASECIRDVGGNRVLGTLENDVKRDLRKILDIPQRSLNFFEQRILKKEKPDWIERRAQAIETLVRAGAGYWYPPYGEPEWITIPAGEFWMGGEGKYDGKPVHKVSLPEYQIARVLVTNYQYGLFVKATGQKAPDHWEEERPPKGLESHPVVKVTWHDAIGYCKWLSKVTGKQICLPSEAEWEKAARGDKDQRAYPWGDEFDPARCNTSELGLGSTTPVGIFLEGESPYGLLDMSGNVWEWTRTIWSGKYSYPYQSDDGREDLEQNSARVLRGGSFSNASYGARCASRGSSGPYYGDLTFGFRVVVSPLLPSS